jgi:hypothetical protein
MTITRVAASAVLVGRVSYGLALIAAPRRLTLRWLGPDVGAAPTQVALRALGARETVLHAGGLLAATRGGPLRPWLAASVVGDLTDVIATAIDHRRLPHGSTAATLAVGGGAALASVALAVAVDS